MKTFFILTVVLSVISVIVLPCTSSDEKSVYALVTRVGKEENPAPDDGPHPEPKDLPGIEPHPDEEDTGFMSPTKIHSALEKEPSYQFEALEDGVTGALPPEKGEASVWYNRRTNMYEMHVGGLPDVSRAVRLRSFLKNVFKSGVEYSLGIRDDSYRPSTRKRALRKLGYYRTKARVMPKRKVPAVDDGSATSAVVTNIPQGQMVKFRYMIRRIFKSKGRSDASVILVDNSGDTDLPSPDQFISGGDQVSTELAESSAIEDQEKLPEHFSFYRYQLIGGVLVPITLEHTLETHNWSHPLAKRDGVDQVIAQEQDSTAAAAANAAAEFQTYLKAFDVAQGNISELLIPFLNAMMNGTNSSVVHDAAWSIYSDMTNSNELVLGPFLYGMNCLDWLEDQVFGNNTNGPYSNSSLSFLDSNSTADLTDTELSIVEYLAVHEVLLDLYNYVWTNGQTAINKTGLLFDMDTLLRYLLPTNQSVMTDGFMTQITKSNDDAYFTSYNNNITPKDQFGNVFVTSSLTANKEWKQR